MSTRRKLLNEVTQQYRNRVRACRLRAMIAKQETLARMTGISRSTINALENNRLFLSAPYALLIAQALGCKLDDLYEPVDIKRKSARLTASRINTENAR